MFYWPAPHPNTACLGSLQASPSRTSAASNETAQQVSSVVGNSTVYATDSDGYVLSVAQITLFFLKAMTLIQYAVHRLLFM